MSEIRFRRDIASNWAQVNRVLDSGEAGYELDTRRLKVGDGRTAWNDLDYFMTSTAVQDLIAAAGPGTGVPGDGSAHDELVAHIQSLTPHPVYDDGPSLSLIYQNAKV